MCLNIKGKYGKELNDYLINCASLNTCMQTDLSCCWAYTCKSEG